jgi:hypothetical protein
MPGHASVIASVIASAQDQYGYNMPDRYKCDSCRAVVHHLNEAGDGSLSQRSIDLIRLIEYSNIFQLLFI